MEAGHPRMLQDTPLARVWHKTDTTFRRPKAVLYIAIMNPRAYSSPEAAVLARLACMLLGEHLNSVTYEASLAGLSFSLSTTSNGFQLVVRGCVEISACTPNYCLSASMAQVSWVSVPTFRPYPSRAAWSLKLVCTQMLARARKALLVCWELCSAQMFWHAADAFLQIRDGKCFPVQTLARTYERFLAQVHRCRLGRLSSLTVTSRGLQLLGTFLQAHVIGLSCTPT